MSKVLKTGILITRMTFHLWMEWVGRVRKCRVFGNWVLHLLASCLFSHTLNSPTPFFIISFDDPWGPLDPHSILENDLEDLKEVNDVTNGDIKEFYDKMMNVEPIELESWVFLAIRGVIEWRMWTLDWNRWIGEHLPFHYVFFSHKIS